MECNKYYVLRVRELIIILTNYSNPNSISFGIGQATELSFIVSYMYIYLAI